VCCGAALDEIYETLDKTDLSILELTLLGGTDLSAKPLRALIGNP
jgi:hypothetical protein